MTFLGILGAIILAPVAFVVGIFFAGLVALAALLLAVWLLYR